MKKIFNLIILLFLASSIFAEMTIFVDVNRFLDVSGKTKYEISYQIPYNQLQFQRVKNGYRALIKIKLSLIKNGKVVFTKPLLRQLLETENVTDNPTYSYQDKLHFSLSKPGFELNLQFTDLVKQDSLIYSKKLINFPINTPISDLELDYLVEKDSTMYKKNFHRNNILYLGNQNHSFNIATEDTIFVYYELYKTDSKFSKLHLFISKEDSVAYDDNFKFPSLDKNINPFVYKINVSNYKTGYYNLSLQILDNEGRFVTERKTFFIIKHPKLKQELVFYNLKDDIKLVKYFLNSKQKRILRSLKDENAIRNYISKFWLSHDINPATEKNEFIEEIKNRINYSNEKFSSFGKGWKSDRGRIYIKYGKPDFKKKYHTNSSSKYPFKNYEVWQYRAQRDQTYIFFDMQANNSYRLIYAGNDPSENSYPNWKEFVGEEFDINDLE